jgi:hypothetical protein
MNFSVLMKLKIGCGRRLLSIASLLSVPASNCSPDSIVSISGDSLDAAVCYLKESL